MRRTKTDATPTSAAADAATSRVYPLANGARLLVLGGPWRTACVSLFVLSGSAAESARENGISHVVEHMAFKGTSTRSAERINRDAEQLGAEVNAHTDKDHTAYHMRGRPEHVLHLVHMLGEIVCDAQFPADELERERQVILQEVAEDDDDPVSTTFKLFDRACFGRHPVAAPVIGSAANIERFTRDDLLRFVRRQYTAPRTVMAVAMPQRDLGRQALADLRRAAEAALAALPAAAPAPRTGVAEPVAMPANAVAAPAPFLGGLKSRRVSGSSQTHLVLGWALPPMTHESAAATLAAAVLGEGMSSPLLDELREKRGLVYHAAASADVLAVCGQFVVEASCSPRDALQAIEIIRQLLERHGSRVATAELERARNLLAVRRLRDEERPQVLLERAALELLVLGRVRSHAEREEPLAAVTPRAVQRVFAQAARHGLAVALGGALPRGTAERALAALGPWCLARG